MTDGYYVAIYKGDSRISTIGEYPSLDDAIFHMEAARTFNWDFDPTDLELIVYDSDAIPMFSLRASNLKEEEVAKILNFDEARDRRG